MDAVLVIIGTITGALVGILGTLLAQREANRAEDRRFERAISEQRRSDLHAAINELLSATQLAEKAADQHGDGQQKSDASHSMWIAHKHLTLICTDDLKTLADNYCDALGRALWGPPIDEPVWSQVRPSSLAFRDQARSELAALNTH